MINKTGNLFDTTANYIGHGVNCVGAMGAGIAKEFRTRYPTNYRNYQRACEVNTLEPGGVFVGTEITYSPDDTQIRKVTAVVNFATQDKPGPNAKYLWVLESFMEFARLASQPARLGLYGGRVAIPEIGCGIGGLEWDKVENIISAVESAYPDVEFEVWHYEG